MTFRKVYPIFISLFIFIIFLSLSALANLPTNLSCGDEITEGGDYVIDGPISCSGSHAIKVDMRFVNSDVNIECKKGSLITGGLNNGGSNDGVYIDGFSLTGDGDLTITGCTFSSFSGSGIYINQPSKKYSTYMSGNTLKENSKGIFIENGGTGTKVLLNIEQNVITNNDFHGIFIARTDAVNIIDNQIKFNNQDSKPDGSGVYLDQSSDIILINNDISENNGDGIGFIRNSRDLIIEENKLYSNSENGLDIIQGSISNAENNEICYNTGYDLHCKYYSQGIWNDNKIGSSNDNLFQGGNCGFEVNVNDNSFCDSLNNFLEETSITFTTEDEVVLNSIGNNPPFDQEFVDQSSNYCTILEIQYEGKCYGGNEIDINGDGVVDEVDLGDFLSDLNIHYGGTYPEGDLTGDQEFNWDDVKLFTYLYLNQP